MTHLSCTCRAVGQLYDIPPHILLSIHAKLVILRHIPTSPPLFLPQTPYRSISAVSPLPPLFPFFRQVINCIQDYPFMLYGFYNGNVDICIGITFYVLLLLCGILYGFIYYLCKVPLGNVLHRTLYKISYYYYYYYDYILYINR